MEFRPVELEESLANPITFSQAQHLKNEATWSQLKDISVGAAIILWLETFDELTRVNYLSEMNRLAELGFIDPEWSLQLFSLKNHEASLDQIKQVSEWSEMTRQSRAACYISFAGFLNRRTQGLIRRAIPSREGHSKTFYRVREKVDTGAMNRAQWKAFLSALKSRNHRDWIIAQTMLQ